MDLLALTFELTLEQLGLRPHGDVLAGSHREGAAQQPSQAREPHHSSGWVRPREAEDQRDVCHEPVADPEHGGARAATLDVAMVMIVHLAAVLRLEPRLPESGRPSADTGPARASLDGSR
jgi:hypothetical protein